METYYEIHNFGYEKKFSDQTMKKWETTGLLFNEFVKNLKEEDE